MTTMNDSSASGRNSPAHPKPAWALPSDHEGRECRGYVRAGGELADESSRPEPSEMGDDAYPDDTPGGLAVAAVALLVALTCCYLVLAWLVEMAVGA